jgi:mono/diheme cytochrome c family protein
MKTGRTDLQKICLCLALLAGADASAADFNLDALIGLIRIRDVRSVEETLALLPPELRESYTLAFSSRSLQDANPSAPRAILYGRDARFVVSFNGEAGTRGYDALETMQFDERSNSFHFREVTFASTGAGALVSEDNPARCAACHGRPARPIWDSPPSWPGIYGERYRTGLSKTESAGMTAFLARQPRDPRYRYLIGARRFGERATYVAGAHALYNGDSVDSPNARLSKLLATMNARSLVSELSNAPAFSPHRYVLLAAAEGTCGSVTSFFPEALQSALTEGMTVYERSSAAAISAQEAAKRMRRTSRSDGYRAGVAAADPIALRFIAEELVGLPPQRWSLALEANTFDSASPDGALSLDQLFFEKIAASEPQFRDLRSVRSFTATDAYCTELRLRSGRELSAFYGADGAERLRAAGRSAAPDETPHPPLLDHCIACHNGEVGPALPFGEPAALGSRLTAGDYPHGRLLDEILYRLAPQAGSARMPRDINPTPVEQQDLENYFMHLVVHQGPRVD